MIPISNVETGLVPGEGSRNPGTLDAILLSIVLPCCVLLMRPEPPSFSCIASRRSEDDHSGSAARLGMKRSWICGDWH